MQLRRSLTRNPVPSTLNESQYTFSVNRKLSSDLYAWKINAQYAPGVPDCWYSGPFTDLWVEWKYKHKMPKKHKPNCSDQQLQWLNREYDNGRNVLVLVGSPEGIVFYEDKKWNSQHPVGVIYSRNEVVHWLECYLRGTVA